MKYLFQILFLLLLFVSCQSAKHSSNSENDKHEISIAQNDSVEYELIVFDSRFETYLVTQPHPQWFYSDEYYKQWNNRYTIEWNIRHGNPLHYGDFYETHIPYDLNTDYGIEFNFRLYHYFQFIEKEYNIVLISRRGTT
ncbi:DUF6146 family protein [Carboxylicivirga sp. N1Y90]|uniref:DUF6146 family protein n=1 Tax=Carboxylicivirga fragile TaxID=3417571 RepID=UPI003D32F209|nr:hypothetical protein [Marinilabiliaceae bacterium N1Y90]